MTEPVTFCIIDIEANGTDPEESEVIELSLLLVDVDPETGRALGPGSLCTQQREPRSMSKAMQDKVGMTLDALRGTEFHTEALHAVYSQADYLVSHMREFDQHFLLPHLPEMASIPWFCILQDIPWYVEFDNENFTLDKLIALTGGPVSSQDTVSDCQAMAQLLNQPLPASKTTGFSYLLDEAMDDSIESL